MGMVVVTIPHLRHGLGTDEDRVRAVDSGAFHRNSAQSKQHQQRSQASNDP